MAITGGAGGGTVYGNGAGYHAHNTITAVGTSTTITASYITGGSAGNGAAATTAGTSNMTWATSTLQGGGNNLLSAITPQGLQCSVLIYTTSGSFYNPGTALNIVPGSRDRARTGPNLLGTGATVVGSSTSFRCICSKYQFLNFIAGTADSTRPLDGVAVFQPVIPTSMQAPAITAATNTSPIVCTIANHGFTTGQSVFIVGGTGNTAVNSASWTITVVDANTFSLTGSTGNGTYTGGAICANLTIGNTIAEAICTSGNDNGAPSTFRSGMNPHSQEVWQSINGTSASNASATSAPVIFWPSNNTAWYDGSFLFYEPLLGWAPTGTGGVQLMVGQLWDAVSFRNSTISLDQTASFDSPSHNFWTTTVDSGSPSSSLLMATS